MPRDELLAQARRNETSSMVATYKLERGCVDCGYDTDPYALDFDHIGPKSFGIAVRAQGGGNRERLLAEMEKCEVVCANCHRVRTADRRPARAG